jgi:hypothetical protein
MYDASRFDLVLFVDTIDLPIRPRNSLINSFTILDRQTAKSSNISRF